MRKIATIAAVAAFLLAIASPAVVAAPHQEQEPEQEVQWIEGSLSAVSLEGMSITVTDAMGEAQTVALAEDTQVSGPEGPLTIADLVGKEGAAVIVQCVENGEGLEADSIELVA